MKLLRNLFIIKLIILLNVTWFGGLIVYNQMTPPTTITEEAKKETDDSTEMTTEETMEDDTVYEDTDDNTESTTEETTAAISPSATDYNCFNEIDLFYFNQLNDKEKEMYTSIYEGINTYKKSIKLDVNDLDELERIFYGVLYDHPEIFWVDRSFQYSYGGLLKSSYQLTPNYTYNKTESSKIQKKLISIADDILKSVSTTATEYDKVVYVYEWLVDNIEYDEEAYNAKKTSNLQNIDSAFLKKKTVCAGYSRATQYLLNLMKIECTYVVGDADNGSGYSPHGWNLVKCEDEYYYIDTTWGDPTYTGIDTNVRHINYSYLNCTSAILMKTHKLTTDGNYQYPECTSMNANYFVKNKCYYTSYDAGTISKKLKKNQAKKKPSQMMFEKQADYNKCLKDLKSSTLINESFSYYHDDDFLTIEIIWK